MDILIDADNTDYQVYSRKREWRLQWKAQVSDVCKHNWIPLSFVFESQILDPDGRIVIKQPALDNARVYCVCMKCRGHTYIETHWVEYFLGSPDDLVDKE